MQQRAEAETGWRGSREGWLTAGQRALIAGGVDAVKIQPIAKRLQLSRTSFYWFFADREALLAALLDHWAARTTLPLIAATEAYAETQTEAVLNLLGCFLSGRFDARLEGAVRAWALQEDKVERLIQYADLRRMQAISDLLRHWGLAPEALEMRARLIYARQIGEIALRRLEDLETRLRRVSHDVEIITGIPVTSQAWARFEAGVRNDAKL